MKYCTLFPDGNWGECCKRHDRRYKNKKLTKKQADILLRRCVKRKVSKVWGQTIGHLMGFIVYIGVRSPFSWYFFQKA